MNNQPDYLDMLFKRAGVRPRLLSEPEVNALLAGVEGASDASRRGHPRPWWRRAMLAGVAVSVAIGSGALVRPKGTATSRVNLSRDSRYQVFVLRDSVTGDSSIITIPVAQRGKDLAQHTSMRSSITGVRFLELTTGELARIGARPDSDGVWVYYQNEHGKVQGLGVTTRGTIFSSSPMVEEFRGLSISTISPVLITDDLGNERILAYDDQRVDSALAARMKELPAGSAERIRLSESIGREARKHTLGRLNLMVPIRVRTGKVYSAADSLHKRWRPDAILWYEPTPEFMALLPERIRIALEQEFAAADIMAGNVQVENGSSIMAAEHSRSTSSVAARQANRPHDLPDSVTSIGIAQGDSTGTPSVARGAVGDGAVTGGASSVEGRIASGALSIINLIPNPAREHTTLRYRLTAPRGLRIMLHNIFGQPLREFARAEMQPAGEWSVDISLAGVRPGVYLIAIATDNGELAVQRLIVDR
jgi:hypothetical protein